MKCSIPIRSLLVLIICTIIQKASQSQPYYFRHYQVENGVSNNSIYFISQDSKGFMWFATKDGLDRFDGFHFKVFRINSPEDANHLTTDYIFSLLPGKNGMLWVGAQRGLYKFDPDKEKLEPFIDSLSNIYDLTMDNAGNLWFISSSTVCRFDFKRRVLKEFDPRITFRATSLCLSKDGVIWASSDNGFLEKFDPINQKFIHFDIFKHSKTPTSRWIQKIRAADNNCIFIGTTSQGLKIFDPASNSYRDILTYNPDKTTIFVRDILKSAENEYWVATETGIFIYYSKTNTFTNLRKKYQDIYSLDDNAIYALFKDKEGAIWAGTFFGGINYYDKQNAAFIKYFPGSSEHPIKGNAVREICKDQFGNLWIGTEDGGLNKISAETGRLQNFKPTGKKNSIAYTNIHGILADGNYLWIGTFEHGIDLMDIRSCKIKKHFSMGTTNNLRSNFALCFLRTKEGKVLVGTSNGLYYYAPETNQFNSPKEIPKNLFITSILESHNKTIWAATNNNGVFWFDPVTHKSGHILSKGDTNNTLTNNYINDIYEDSKNDIWFSTEGGGLCRLDSSRKRFTSYTTKDGLPSNFIFKVLEDNDKNLWASTSRGLVKFGPGFTNPLVFTQANGLLNNQFNYHSGYKDSTGRLYFGSVKGMVTFMPKDISKPEYIPSVYITGMQIFGVDVNTKKDSSFLKKAIVCSNEITLPYYQSSISFDFAALSYISPGMTYYKYKLKGLDKEWTTINTNRKVYFTNLSPGKYVFKIRASLNDLWSNKNEKDLTIIITPPLWATWWAYLIYVLVGLLFVYYFLNNYHKRQHEKKEKEIYESKINFFTNVAHEIRTPLTLIKGPVENLLEIKEDLPEIKEDLECLDRNTNRLTQLVSQVLDFRQTEVKKFTLDFAPVNVNKLLTETYLSFKILAQKRKLEFELIMPDSTVFANGDAEALQKIFSNLIGNAVKYAKRKVVIKMPPADNHKNNFFITFENDGYLIQKDLADKIFEPFYRIKETNFKKGTGIGLTLAKSLTELHKGSLKLIFEKDNFNVFQLSLPLESEKVETKIIM
ncbi:MAG: ligand-binding sensor domain-containing protein [Ginsengibacter sp.]